MSLENTARRASYGQTEKAKFKRNALALLKQVNKALDLNADIRFNPGGWAVSGDAMLHADKVYIAITSSEHGVMYRTVKGRKDYSGGFNHWYSWSALEANGARGLIDAVKGIIPDARPIRTEQEKRDAHNLAVREACDEANRHPVENTLEAERARQRQLL
jgi:hypothetical protein